MITPLLARQRIEDETQWQAPPLLTVDEVDRLLGYAQTVDAAGLLPGEDGYVETYTALSLGTAIAAGWRWKRGKVAGAANVRAGDVALDREHLYDQLTRQANDASRIAVGSGRVGGIGVVTITTVPDLALLPYIRTTDSL